MAVELFDVATIERDKKLIQKFSKIAEVWKATFEGHYVFDYPFIARNYRRGLVVDLGCGIGALPFYLAEEGNTVLAIDKHDVSWRMETHNNIRFMHANLGRETLRMGGRPLIEPDCIVAASSLDHNPKEKVKEIFEEAMYILKKGGLFVATLEAYPDGGYVQKQDVYRLTAQDIYDIFGEKADFSRFNELYRKFHEYRTKAGRPFYHYQFLPFGVVIKK
jgi:SAM-dependent methyltransferase